MVGRSFNSNSIYGFCISFPNKECPSYAFASALEEWLCKLFISRHAEHIPTVQFGYCEANSRMEYQSWSDYSHTVYFYVGRTVYTDTTEKDLFSEFPFTAKDLQGYLDEFMKGAREGIIDLKVLADDDIDKARDLDKDVKLEVINERPFFYHFLT